MEIDRNLGIPIYRYTYITIYRLKFQYFHKKFKPIRLIMYQIKMFDK